MNKDVARIRDSGTALRFVPDISNTTIREYLREVFTGIDTYLKLTNSEGVIATVLELGPH